MNMQLLISHMVLYDNYDYNKFFPDLLNINSNIVENYFLLYKYENEIEYRPIILCDNTSL